MAKADNDHIAHTRPPGRATRAGGARSLLVGRETISSVETERRAVNTPNGVLEAPIAGDGFKLSCSICPKICD